jgi:hypothetical protein
MPTAVERLLDSFLKLDDQPGQIKLDNAFSQIDSDLQKLLGASTDDFLKLEHGTPGPSVFDTIGHEFLKVGDDFQKLDTGMQLIDQFVVKYNPGLQPDFQALDLAIKGESEDHKHPGDDFMKLGSSNSLEAFHIKLDGIANDFLTLSGDSATTGDAFMKLGGDFNKLAGNSDHPSPFAGAYKELGGDFQKVGEIFENISFDYHKLETTMQGGGGGSGISPSLSTADAGVGLVGVALTALSNDFHQLGTALSDLAGGATTLIDDLSHHHSS